MAIKKLIRADKAVSNVLNTVQSIPNTVVLTMEEFTKLGLSNKLYKVCELCKLNVHACSACGVRIPHGHTECNKHK